MWFKVPIRLEYRKEQEIDYSELGISVDDDSDERVGYGYLNIDKVRYFHKFEDEEKYKTTKVVFDEDDFIIVEMPIAEFEKMIFNDESR